MFHPPAKFFCFRKQLFYPLATQTAHESFWRFVGVGLSKFFMYRSRQRIKRSLTCFIQQRKSLVLFSLTGMWLPKLLMPRPIRWQEQAESRPAAGICPKRCSPVWDASCPVILNQAAAACILPVAGSQWSAVRFAQRLEPMLLAGCVHHPSRCFPYPTTKQSGRLFTGGRSFHLQFCTGDTDP